MSDKSLPKPVLPKDPTSSSPPTGTTNVKAGVKAGVKAQAVEAKPQMPPSARVKLSTANPPAGAQSASPMSKPPGMRPPTSTPSAVKPPSLKSPTFSSQSTPPSTPSPTSASPASGHQSAPNKSGANKSTPNKTPGPKPTFAKVKNSPFKYLPFIVGGLALIGVVWAVFSKLAGGSKNPQPTASPTTKSPTTRKTVPAQQTTLVYWGLWEPDNAIKNTLVKFEEANPGVKVSYVKQSHKDYRERLQAAIASGNGPDIFRYHASWTPMLSRELASMPQSVMSASEYQATFYPVAAKMLNIKGQIVGIPLMYDGLGLYYNQEMLTAANSQPPSTWAELKVLANKLAVRDGDNLKRGGVAIGNASNVEHFADILGLLMLQNGADLADPSSKEAQDALSFYTNFVKQDKVWDDKLPSSTVAFARGDVAMMLAPSWRAHEIKAMNPELNFGIVPVPRLGDERLAWASFWAEGVSDKSKNKDLAWALLKFLSSKEIQQELYSAQSQIRPFGEIYSRVDLANDLAGDELVSPFLEDAPAAVGWQLSSYTHDNGINDLLIKYYQDAVNAVLGGESVEKALVTVTQGTRQVLRQYGVK